MPNDEASASQCSSETALGNALLVIPAALPDVGQLPLYYRTTRTGAKDIGISLKLYIRLQSMGPQSAKKLCQY